MPIATVKQLCETSPVVASESPGTGVSPVTSLAETTALALSNSNASTLENRMLHDLTDVSVSLLRELSEVLIMGEPSSRGGAKNP